MRMLLIGAAIAMLYGWLTGHYWTAMLVYYAFAVGYWLLSRKPYKQRRST